MIEVSACIAFGTSEIASSGETSNKPCALRTLENLILNPASSNLAPPGELKPQDGS